jgi:hypothetical protein
METKEAIIKELDLMPEEALKSIYQFIEFQKYQIDDTTYLSSIPTMKNIIMDGLKEEPSECSRTLEWE